MSYETVVEQWTLELRRARRHAYLLHEYGYNRLPSSLNQRRFEVASAYAQGLAIVVSALSHSQTPNEFLDRIDVRAQDLESALSPRNAAVREQGQARLKNTVSLILSQIAA